MFKGCTVALVTPFTADGALDEESLRNLVEFHVERGTNGLLPCGTTGESPTLTEEEHGRVIQIVVETSNKRLPVMAGTGSNSTAEAVHYTQHAEKVGADAALVVTPYYNKPTQKGLYLHFKAIADNTKLPIFLYNIEGRAARNIETETVARLARDCKNIVGVKEASGSIQQATDVRTACGDDFIILSGDDALTLPMMDIGGSGVISVVANIVPQDVVAMIEAYNAGNKEEASAINDKLAPLVAAMFVETNPIPVKKAAAMLGLCGGHLRLPMCDLEEENQNKIKQALEAYGLTVAA